MLIQDVTDRASACDTNIASQPLATSMGPFEGDVRDEFRRGSKSGSGDCWAPQAWRSFREGSSGTEVSEPANNLRSEVAALLKRLGGLEARSGALLLPAFDLLSHARWTPRPAGIQLNSKRFVWSH